MTDTQKNKPTWIPLESNPEAFNKYIDKLGVKGVECHDLMGFDQELINFVPGPHLALVFCYPYQEKANKYLKELYSGLEASDKAKVPDWAFFMKQNIRNACGTFALFHALTNNTNRIDLGSGEFALWYKEAKQVGVHERSDLLAKKTKLAELHQHCATNESETNWDPDHVEYHFISYVNHGGRLFEFDSGQEFPRDCGPTSDSTLLADAGKVCNELMSKLDAVPCNAIAISMKHA